MDVELQRVGVLGLGRMGSRIAVRLLDAGFEVHVWDRRPESVVELGARGARVASSPAELASRVGAALSVLADDDAVREVVVEGGVLASLPAGSIFADLSTTSAELAVELAELGAEAGVDVLDVEMSGSTPQVEAGELLLFAGGDATVLARAHPLLEPIARAILHVGGHGDAARTKLVVNLVLGVGMQALAEALAFGESTGLDRERLLDALEQTAVVAPAHRPKLANARTGEYEAAFTLALMHKDFGLVLAAAADAGLELPATLASAEACAAALEAEGGDEDFSVVIRWLERRLAERRP